MNKAVSTEALEQLAPSVFLWLQDTDLESIQDYYHKLPQEREDIISKMIPFLMFQASIERTRKLSTWFSTNAPTQLTNPDLTLLVNDLSIYSAASVATQYSNHHTGLIMNLKPGTNVSDIASWAASWANGLLNIQYFATVAQFEEYSIYLNSFISQQFALEELQSIAKSFDDLLNDIDRAITDAGFEPIRLSTELSNRLHKTLDTVSFLPPQLIEELGNKLFTEDSYKKIAGLAYVCELTIELIRTNYTEKERARIALWESLRKKWLSQTFLEDPSSIEDRPDDSQRKRAEWIYQLITPSFIGNQTQWEYIRSYLLTIPYERRDSVREELIYAISRLAIIRLYFDSIDMDFFLQKIQSFESSSERAEFIASLEPKVDPELWPMTQKAMQMIASIL
ncbi:MAG: hypothetical protein K0S20_410 [Patescibacteria group bacterium]|jgi:hypothetical protein|nr:hypothetical protein [Patescibacteria group bacterium]